MRYHDIREAIPITVFAVAILAIATYLAIAFFADMRRPPASSADLPSGIWAGLVDDLPSGRVVECVMVRDPGGSVGITCDWSTAVIPRR